MLNNTYWQTQNDSSCNRAKEAIKHLQDLNFRVELSSPEEVFNYNSYVESIKCWACNLHTLYVEEK